MRSTVGAVAAVATLALSALVAGPVIAAEPDDVCEPSVLTYTWGTAQWGATQTDDGKDVLCISSGEFGPSMVDGSSKVPWNTGAWKDTPFVRVEFMDPENTVLHARSSHLFWGMDKVTEIRGIGEVNTDAVESVWLMFGNMSSLQSVDLTEWNTENLTTASGLFEGASAITSVGDLSSWSVPKLENVSYMFSQAESMTEIDLSGWGEAPLTTINAAFAYTKSLENLNVSNWNISEADNISAVFMGASKLKTIEGVDGWNTGNVVYMAYLFQGMPMLEEVDLSGWTTDNVQQMQLMFDGDTSLRSIGDVSHWNTASVGYINGAFQNASSLTKLDLSGWTLAGWSSRPEDMFAGATGLQELTLGSNTVLGSDVNLPAIDPTSPYTGEWVRVSPLPEDSAEEWWRGDSSELVTLAGSASNSFAGTYVWQTEADVTFDLNGGEGSGFDAIESAVGNVVTIPTPDPTRYGYTFEGWTQADTRATASYQGGDQVVVNAPITLVAQWEAITFTVKFDLNEGTGTFPDMTVPYEDFLTLPSASPEREGHKFTGWLPVTNQRSATQLQPNGTYQVLGDVTMTAQWEEVSPTPEPKPEKPGGGIVNTGVESLAPLLTAAGLLVVVGAAALFMARRRS